MKYFPFLVLFFCIGLTKPGRAQTVVWGSSAFEDHFQSDGTSSLTSSGFTFQIGTFAGSIDPNVNDPNALAAAWRVADESDYREDIQFFSGQFTLDGNGFSSGTGAAPGYDFRGEKLYIWVFDGMAPAEDNVTEVCHEWALFTGDWTLPGSVDQTDLPFEYLTSTADAGAPIYGGLDGVQAPDGGTFDAPTGVFELQTHEICLQAIPEPASVTLLIVGFCAVVKRRNRI